MDLLVEHVPAPEYDPDHPLQAHVTNLDASPVRRPARDLPRPQRHDPPAASRSPGAAPTAAMTNAKVAELYITEALDRVDADEAGPGEIIAVAGLPDVTIGETLADPEDPQPLPVITVDEPSLSRHDRPEHARRSPASDGDKLTSRQIKDRLDAEMIGNVSIRVLETERPDTWEVQGRGELQLAILVELMRREGFELTVGKPQVVIARDRRHASTSRSSG